MPISYVPPDAVRAAAKRGLDARRQAPKSQRGGLTASQAGAQGIGSGVVRAQTLAGGRSVSTETVKRMHAFFSRHRKNKDTPRGRIAWDLWGGDAGARWAAEQVNAMRTKTAADLQQNVGGALVGALAGAIAGSRRSLDGNTLQGMQQGALVGMLAGIAAAQGTDSKALQFGAGALGGVLSSRGPRGPSRPQIHLRMDRHVTGEQESTMAPKHAARYKHILNKVASLRERFFVKEALSPGVVARAAAARGVSSERLRGIAQMRAGKANRKFLSSPMHRNTAQLMGSMNKSPTTGAAKARAAEAGNYLNSWSRSRTKTAEGNFGHGAELAGLAMLAAPSIQHFRGKPMSDRRSHAVNAVGLGVLAAPSLLALARRKKTASVRVPHKLDDAEISMARRGTAYGAGIGALNAALHGGSIARIASGTLNGAILGYAAGAIGGSVFGAGRAHQERLMTTKRAAAKAVRPPWKRKTPGGHGDSAPLSDSGRAKAKARAADAGRTYPNLIDNMWASKNAANKTAISEQGDETFSPRPKKQPSLSLDADHDGEAVAHPLALARRRRFNTLNKSKD